MSAVGNSILRERGETHLDVKKDVLKVHALAKRTTDTELVNFEKVEPEMILVAGDKTLPSTHALNKKIAVAAKCYLDCVSFTYVRGNAIVVYSDEDYQKLGLGDPKNPTALNLRTLSFKKECSTYNREQVLELAAKSYEELFELAARTTASIAKDAKRQARNAQEEVDEATADRKIIEADLNREIAKLKAAVLAKDKLIQKGFDEVKALKSTIASIKKNLPSSKEKTPASKPASKPLNEIWQQRTEKVVHGRVGGKRSPTGNARKLCGGKRKRQVSLSAAKKAKVGE
jgi:hypothetical protein